MGIKYGLKKTNQPGFKCFVRNRQTATCEFCAQTVMLSLKSCVELIVTGFKQLWVSLIELLECIP